MPILLKPFHEIERERTVLKSFYKLSVTLIPKPDTTTRKKRIIAQSLNNLDAKILNKKLANQIQQHIKKIVY
jgi:hypothetical protein